MAAATKIISCSIKDVRFPTSEEGDGSDAMHGSPDYSCAYIILHTNTPDLEGHGFAFTLGRGTHIVCEAMQSLSKMVLNLNVQDIFSDFAGLWRNMTSEGQMRWLGPEKGVIHLATAAVVNALWDLWGKIEGKPVWKLLVDMEPEQLVSTIDFRYLSDALTKQEAIDILKKMQKGKAEREAEMLAKGYPAYTTSAGWLGYDDEKIKRLCREALAEGFTRFKVKVGANLEDDIRRCGDVREVIGYENKMMTDANQRWDVQQSIDWMTALAKFKPLWIEEPTSPDDILGHAAIAKALKPLGIGVATGECCHNRVMFKQFFQSDGLQFCQIDSCRMGGVNEILSVILMAAKFGVPICPHAGGVGLCELVHHLSIFDYICVSGSLENRMIEFVDHLHEHFLEPVRMVKGCYQCPKRAGYSSEMKEASLVDYEYLHGHVWKRLFKEGKFTPENDMDDLIMRSGK